MADDAPAEIELTFSSCTTSARMVAAARIRKDRGERLRGRSRSSTSPRRQRTP
jgi:hypothetical protein